MCGVVREQRREGQIRSLPYHGRGSVLALLGRSGFRFNFLRCSFQQLNLLMMLIDERHRRRREEEKGQPQQ
jgi:hypothetical protein